MSVNKTTHGLIGVKSAPKKKIVHESLKKQSESKLQEIICEWINNNWPGTKFVSDFAAGLHLPPQIAVKVKKQSCIDKWLDLTILEPRGGYFGLIIEIKTLDGDVVLRNGKISSTEHTQAQLKTINDLRLMGYCSMFGVGEDKCKQIINWYKLLPITPAIKVLHVLV